MLIMRGSERLACAELGAAVLVVMPMSVPLSRGSRMRAEYHQLVDVPAYVGRLQPLFRLHVECGGNGGSRDGGGLGAQDAWAERDGRPILL